MVHSGITRKAQKIHLTRSESRLYQSQKKTHRKYTVTDALTDSPPIVDLLVIGGGINGAGVAADAAGRGLSVMLVEKGDLASGTSSWSTKLIHGGLRYLEFYEFGLVRKALLLRGTLGHYSKSPENSSDSIRVATLPITEKDSQKIHSD